MKYLTATVRGLPTGTTARQVEDNFNSSIHPESPCIAGPIVEELQGGTCSTTVTFQKERKGQKRGCETLKEQFHRSHFGGLQSTISVSDEFLGLNALAGRADAPVHVYFVHGLGGHAFKTWSSDVQGDSLLSLKAWPRDFLPKRLTRERVNARVYSIGYNANVIKKAAPNATIITAAEDLLMRLRSDRGREPPQEIYFVCHSLGGIVVCQALNMALFRDEDCPNKKEYRDLFIHRDTCLLKGVVLMGTPLRGSGQANIIAPIVRLVKGLNKFAATNDNFMKALRENKDTIDIPNIMKRFKSVIDSNHVMLLIACEETPYIGDSLTTSYESAVTIFRDIVTPFRIQDSDHLSMVKFADQNEPEYQMLENLIVKMIKPESSNRVVEEPMGAPQPPPDANRHLNQTNRGAPSPLSQRNDPSLQRARDVPGINVFVNVTGQQNSFPYPSRQQTDPALHRAAQDAHAHASSGPASGHSDFQPRPLGRAQTEHNTTNSNDKDPFNRLWLFDTALIVDDTGSMVTAARNDEPLPAGDSRWTVTKQAVQHIAQIAAKHDSDGIELRFLKSRQFNDDNIRDGQQIKDKLDEIDLWDGSHGGGTYFQAETGLLEELIGPRVNAYQWYVEDMAKYNKELRQAMQDRSRRTPKPVKPDHPKPYNLIVITDGAADDRPEVEEYIVSVATQLDNLRAPSRQIGIQFVQVGEDANAKKWLDRLDDELKNRVPPVRDIVDTTPFDSHLLQSSGSLAQALEQVLANVLRKALLGGVTDEEDRRVNEVMVSELGY